jgi:glycosyltransferase involved in cell wall biosynthesis
VKVLHLPESYLPWRTGGKEVYCHTLAKALQADAVESIVAVHQNAIPSIPTGTYSHEGIPVHVLPPLPGYGQRRALCTREFDEIPGFEELLEKLGPDVVHFHDQGGGASLTHLKAVKARKIAAVLTYHTPGQTCPQSELMRFGRIPCDGALRLQRCTNCRLSTSGLPRPFSDLAALAEWPGFDPWSGSSLARVMTARKMVKLFRQSLRQVMELADAIVILAEWSREVWLCNGAPREKIHLIRTGGQPAYAGNPGPRYPERKPFRIVCSGRCTRIKGFHVLVEAVKQLPADLAIEVNFLGPYWDGPYGRQLLERIAGDPRFKAPILVPNAEMFPVLAGMDLAVIPSLWLETGPLTAFDAFAAGLPICGSRLGGIAEVICDGVDGRLFESGDSSQLARILMDLYSHPEKLEELRENVRQLRTFREIARETTALYNQLLIPE